MADDWRSSVISSGGLTRDLLFEITQFPDRIRDDASPEAVDGFTRWLGNTFIQKIKLQVPATVEDMIEALQVHRIPGPLREALKTYLVLQLFTRLITGTDMGETGPFLAEVKDPDLLAQARQIMNDDAASFGVHQNLAFLAAAEAYAVADLRVAYVHFDAMRRALLAGEFVGAHAMGALSTRPLQEFEAAIATVDQASPVRKPVALDEVRAFARPGPVALIGVDGTYHEKYAERLTDSAAGKVNIHFHVCNPDGITRIKAGNVRYSFEEAPDANPAYFASTRFLILRQILEHYRQPVVTLDADCYFLGEPPYIFDILPNFDLALGPFPGIRGLMPWRYVNAQVLAANPVESAFRFLRYFEAQFDHLLRQDGKVSWYVDQALLTSSLILARDHGFADRFLVHSLNGLSGTVQSKI